MSRKAVEIAGRRLFLSNLEKDLYPSYGFTKAPILEYYLRIAKYILPYLKNRAMTLKRYPEGVDKDFFFAKRCPSHRLVWVKTKEVRRDDNERMTVCLVNDLETLIWVENLASVELHVLWPGPGTLKHPIPWSSIWTPDMGRTFWIAPGWLLYFVTSSLSCGSQTV